MTYAQPPPSPSTTKAMTRGDSKDFRITLTTPPPPECKNLPPPRLDLTGGILVFTMKAWRVDGRPVSADAVVIRKTSDDTSEIEILSQVDAATKGQAVIHLLPQDTKFLAPGVYRYDVQLTTAAGKVYTVVSDQLYLRDDVSSAEDLTNP